eukprot:1196334-Prorocentrum_minimum.AAC.8
MSGGAHRRAREHAARAALNGDGGVADAEVGPALAPAARVLLHGEHRLGPPQPLRQLPRQPAPHQRLDLHGGLALLAVGGLREEAAHVLLQHGRRRIQRVRALVLQDGHLTGPQEHLGGGGAPQEHLAQPTRRQQKPCL